jgi:ferrous iron transport protein B
MKHVWFRTGFYLKKIGGVILVASIIVWVLSNFPRNISYSKDYIHEIGSVENMYKQQISNIDKSSTETQQTLEEKEQAAVDKLSASQREEKQSKSYMGLIGRTIAPVMKPLGFDWKMSVSILSGFAAKEVVVSTMGILYQTDVAHAPSSLVEKIQSQQYSSGKKVFTPLIAFCFMLFILTYFPCAGVVAAIKKESGSWKWAAFTVFYTSGIAWGVAFLTYSIGSLFR